MIKRAAIFAICTLLLVACIKPRVQLPSAAPYLTTERARFLLEGKEGIKYDISYVLKKGYDRNLSVKMEFDNPKPGAKPLITEQFLYPYEKRIVIQSPSLPGITNNKKYKAKLFLYSYGKLLGVQEEHLFFSVPQNILDHSGIKQYRQ